jgi:hypothetical protein
VPDARGSDAGRVKPETRWKARQDTTIGVSGARGGGLVGSGGGCRVHLVIVQRGQDALYARLTSRPWREAVTVIWDRRLYERRRAVHQGGRRHGDRRRAPPDTWAVLGFLVAQPEKSPP